jgi:flagellar hook-associated protein 1 FlgK
MSTSTFGSFEAAKSGLSVAMQQLNVTEQNIANVNTPGYSRQRIQTSAKEPAASTYLVAQLNKALVGQGVETTGIQQIRSVYLDKQYRTLNANYNYSTSRSSALEYLTGLFNELNDEGSLTTSIGSFFSSLNTFASDTSSKEFRTNVQQQALSMTQNFNNIYEEMQSLWHDQNDSIATAAQKINAIAQKITQLNDAIARIAQTGSEANDLNDERNLLLDELSGYVNVSYSVNADNNNMIDVSIGGLRLVEGKTANLITVDSPSAHTAQIDLLTNQIAAINGQIAAGTMTPADGQTAINDIINGTTTPPGLMSYLLVTTSANADNADLIDVRFNGVSLVTGAAATPSETAVATDLTAWVAYNRNNLTLGGNQLSIESGTVTGGQLYSNMEMVSSQSALNPGIPFYMDQINSFIREMAENLNNISRSGWTYPDGTSPSVTGINLFKVPSYVDGSGTTVYDYSRINAGNFTLSDEVILSAFNIAGSSQQVVVGASSTESGNNIIARQLFNDLSSSGYYDKLNSIIGNLAIASNTSDSIMSTKESLIQSIDTQRQSISAVSLDEETTNLIIFQQSYQACARVITTLDEMLEAMINRMGITGR